MKQSTSTQSRLAHNPGPPPLNLDEVTVADLMHRGVISCRADAPLLDVARMMAEHHVHAVVVDGIRRGRAGMEHLVWGVVSDLDLVGHVDGVGAATAGEMSATLAVVVAPEDPVSQAAQLMHDYDVHHLVVVDSATRRPVGVLSTLDVIGDIVARHGA